MIIKNSFLAKLLTKGKNEKHYVRFGWIFFTRYKYLEVWEEMELQIYARQYWECFLLTFVPAFILSTVFSWFFLIIPFVTFDFLLCLEKKIRSHSIFVWEGRTHAGDALYLRKRKSYAWMKNYGHKNLPESEWN